MDPLHRSRSKRCNHRRGYFTEVSRIPRDFRHILSVYGETKIVIIVDFVMYIYNSVCALRHKHINSFASAQLNATQIAVMKGSHWRVWMVGPDILFSTYQCCFLAVFCAKWLHKAGSSPTNLTSARLRRSAGGTGGGPTWSVQWT